MTSSPKEVANVKVHDPPLLRRFGFGVFWNLVATVFNQGSTFVTNVAVANLLGKNLFGKYAMILSTVQAVSGLAALGMGYTATKYIAELRQTDTARASRILGFCSITAYTATLCVASGLLLGSSWIATSLLHAPDLVPYIRVSVVTIVFASISGYFTGLLAGLEEYRLLAMGATVAGGVYFLVCTGGAYWWGVRGAVGGLAISGCIQWIILRQIAAYSLRKHNLVPNFREIGRERPIIVRWVIPGLLSGLTAIPALWLGQSFLSRQPHGFEELAVYSASYSLMSVVLLLPNVANYVGMSLINHTFGLGNRSAYGKVFWLNLQVTLAVQLVGAVIIGLSGRTLLRIYGPAFVSGYFTLIILLAATLPESLTIALSQILQSKEKGWLAIAAINIPRDALIIVAAYKLTPLYGAEGLAIAYLVGRIVGAISTALCAQWVGLTIVTRGV